MALIKIAGVVNDSIVDGEGFRFTIFTQGCYHNCPQCHNPQTHDVNGGHEVDTDDLLSQICENPLLNGVTFSGGEPFLQAKPLAQLAKEVHKRGLNITTFTGYTLEQLQKIMKPENFVGRAPQQTEEYIREVIQPILDENKEILGLTAEINV